MATYVKVEQFGANPIIWSLPDLFITIGINHIGAVSYNNVITPWFSLIFFKDSCFAYSHLNTVHVNEAEVSNKSLSKIELGSSITVSYTHLTLPTKA